MIYNWDIKEMADKHAKFLTELLTTTNGVTIKTCEYLAKEVFIHAWKHAEEEYKPKQGRDGRFIKK